MSFPSGLVVDAPALVGTIALARAAPLAPGAVANLALWFDASQITGKINNDPISQWNDLSGSANHAIQAIGTKQPLYKTNVQNGLPGLLFDNVDDGLHTGNLTVNVPGVTVFAVAVSGTNFGVIVESGTVWTVNNGFVMQRDNANRINIAVKGAVGMPFAHSGSITASVPRMISGVYDKSLSAGEVRLWVDGIDRTVLTDNSDNVDAIMPGANPINLGSRGDGASVPLNGYLHEILIYRRALTTSERRGIESYLRGKWGTS